MKTFEIKIRFIEDGKEQIMVEHIGFTFEEICKIETYIQEIQRS